MKLHTSDLRLFRHLFMGAASATLLGWIEYASGVVTIPSGSSTVNLQNLSSTETAFQVLPGATVDASGNAIQGNNSKSWTLTNQGTLLGTGIGVQLASPSSLTNTGIITGSSGTAISLLGGNSTLTLGASSILNGNVAASGANNTLILQGTGNEDSSFSGFTTITQQGTNWALGSLVLLNTVNLNSNVNINNGTQLSIAGMTGGTGGSSRLNIQGGGTLVLTGSNNFLTGLNVTGSTLSVGADDNLGAPTNYVTLASGSTLKLTGSFQMAHTLQLVSTANTVDTEANTVTLSKPNLGSGGLVKVGTGTLILAANNTSKGGVTNSAGSLQLGNGGTSGSVLGNLINNSALVINRAGNVDLNRDIIQNILTGSVITTPGNLTGSGTLTQAGSGALTISTNQVYTGLTTAATGTLLVNGTIPGAAQVNSGATLGGIGTVGGAVAVANDGHLAPGTANPGTLNTGTLTLGNTSQLDYSLELPEGTNDLTRVNGNLTLDGTLNLANLGGMSPGVYRLFDYTGTLTDNGLTVGASPTRFSAGDFLVQTSTPGQVNLIVSAGGYAVQFWDGGNTTGNSVVDGGNGTWTNAPTNWTNIPGSVNAPWQGGYAVFAGPPGIVTLGENINVQGLQFLSGGYTVQGNGFSLAGEPQTNVRVAARGVAIIDAPIIDGTGGPTTLNVGDAGLLVLNGANTYSGGTVVNGGFVQISSDSNLGAANGKLTLNGGDLLTSNSLASSRSIQLQTFGGVFSPAEGTTLTLSGPISGGGTLDKGGPGTLVLNGNNSYGNTIVSGGTLIGNTSSLPGNINNNSALVFNQTNDGTFSGNLSGPGTFSKQGVGELAFEGTSTLTGMSTVQNGTLRANGVMDGPVQVEPGATLGGIGTIDGTVAIASEGHLQPGTATPGTLTTGALTLGGTSNLDYGLQLPQSINNLTRVNGNLTLDGTLNLTNLGGMSTGVYRLFDYTGILTDNGLTLGSNLPDRFSPSDFLLQTSTPGQVNLIVSAGGYALQFWDGGSTTANAIVDGGNGTWTQTPTNWTNSEGSVNAPWQSGYAVFTGAPGTVTLGGNIQFEGLQFLSGGYTVLGNGFTLAGQPQSFVRVATGEVATINAPIVDGAGGATTLNINDAGLLVLNGANTYSGGTIVTGGSVQISSDNNLGAKSGKLILNGGELLTSSSLTSARGIELQNSGGVLSPAENTTLTLSGSISGRGTLDKSGAGTLVLSGINSYGDTIINDGTLIGSTKSLPGNITNNSALVFDQPNDGVYSGNISGSGIFSKQGAGELEFTGTSTSTGMSTVQNGTLRVNGSMEGPLTVNETAILRGSGQVGSTVNAGTVAPGNSIGILNVNGDYTQRAGSELQVEVAHDGTADLLQVAGNTTLEGGTVSVLPQPGSYAAPMRYLIVNSGSGVTGTFDGLAEQRAFFKIGLEYQPTQVFLRVQPLPFNNPNTCVSHNTCELTSALDAAVPRAGPGMTQLLQALAPLSDSEVLATLNSLTGDVHPTLASLALEGPALVGQSVSRRLGELRGRSAGELPSAMALANSPLLLATLDTNNQRLAEMAAAASSADTPTATQGGWGRVYGVKGEVDADGNASGADSRLWGAIIGADKKIDENWVAGTSFNYSVTRVDTDHNRDYGEVKAYDLAGYGSYTQGRDHLDMLVSYSYLDNETRRDLSAGALTRTAKADYNGNRVSFFTEGGRRYDINNSVVAQALASVQYVWLRQDDFAERDAGALGLSADAETTQSLRTALGGSLSKAFDVNDLHVVPEVRARWLYEFLDNYAQYDPAFIGAPDQTFNIRGTKVDRSSIALGAGVEMARRDGLTFFVDVDSRFNADMRNYSLTGGFRYWW